MKHLSELLIRAVKVNGLHHAIESEDGCINYQELDRCSRSFAEKLLADFPDTTHVVIYLPKSIDYLVAMWGCIYAGITYVPFSLKSPVSRLVNVLSQLDSPLLVCETEISASDLNQQTWQISKAELKSLSSHKDVINPKSNRVCCILFTSGSTGKPKGVMVSHENVLNFIKWAVTRFDFTSIDRFANHAEFNFDISTLDLFASVCCAATLCLPPTGLDLFPAAHIDWLIREKVSVWYSVPSIMVRWIQKGKMGQRSHKLTSLRAILFAGEPFPMKDLVNLRSFYSNDLYNLYGPTETNVCTYYQIPSYPDLSKMDYLPIGKAIAGTSVYIEGGGLEGELVCIGKAVTLGYHSLSKNGDGFFSQGDHRGYRTGDKVRQVKEGYTYLGRVDGQINLNGFRIERNEIVQVLQSTVDLKGIWLVKAIVDEANLVAFYSSDKPILLSQMTKACRLYLPSYMQPKYFFEMTSPPLTDNGKIDYKSLQVMAQTKIKEITKRSMTC